MPTLDLNDWNPTDFLKMATSCAKVLSVMHFPDDHDLRKVFTINKVNEALDHKRKTEKLSDATYYQLAAEYLEPLGGIQLLNNSCTKEELDQQVKKLRGDASIAGSIFWGIHFFYLMNPTAEKDDLISINKMKFLLEEKLANSNRPIKVRRIGELWTAYKSVAHLWAASQDIQESHYASTPSIFSPSSLPHFLSCAELFLKFGESFTPHGQQQPLLSDEDIWALPSEFSIPASGLNDSPLPEDFQYDEESAEIADELQIFFKKTFKKYKA